MYRLATLVRPQLLRPSFSVQPAFFSTLVIGEHDNNGVTPATRSAITAGLQLSPSGVSLLLAESPSSKASENSTQLKGVTKILSARDAAFEAASPESLAKLLLSVQKANSFTHILAPSSIATKSFLPRAAASLNVSPITDVIKVESSDTFIRPVYAGNAIATVQSLDDVKVILVRPTAFEKSEETSGSASVEQFPVDESIVGGQKSKHESFELTKSDRPELTNARIVVSGGRALKSKDNFALIDQLADKLGAAVGASRAAVDAGYAPNDQQVGQTGKIVAPEVYFAFGISGAIQHVAGMKDSKVIVAVNKDPEAPIFQIADYSLTEDLFKAIPEFISLLEKK
eukprot:TRINITY_DN2499_c0_g1_i1.p1 TRINITY_DN2499_c0_g1~~TRINITY_DN2499_c0_g1_i1.p1  ORF type:complete len:342 (+),score=174.90 TRINITY_DN2499_c0_g1_i1:266-1291(+)